MNSGKLIKSVLKGALWAVLFMLAGVIILSCVMGKFEISKQVFNTIYTIILLAGLALGAVIAGGKNGSKGLFVGILVTLIYCVIIYTIGKFVFGNEICFSAGEIVKLIAAVFIGMIGSVLGVNMSDS